MTLFLRASSVCEELRKTVALDVFLSETLGLFFGSAFTIDPIPIDVANEPGGFARNLSEFVTTLLLEKKARPSCRRKYGTPGYALPNG